MRLATSLIALSILAGCSPRETTRATPAADSAYAALQQRGARVMGVDQEASEHVFEDLADGGRILFRMKDADDTAGARVIREHLRSIADSFAAGVFTDPSLVHAQAVPGTGEMARLRDRIAYRMEDRPAGGELRLTTADSAALAAIHQFLAFQRSDHRAAGHEGMDHGDHPTP